MLANISDNCFIIEINLEYTYQTQVEAKHIHSLTLFSSLHVHKDGQIIILFSNKKTTNMKIISHLSHSSSLRCKYGGFTTESFWVSFIQVCWLSQYVMDAVNICRFFFSLHLNLQFVYLVDVRIIFFIQNVILQLKQKLCFSSFTL